MAEVAVPYEYEGRQFEGRLVYDESVTAKRPAILMQPDWLGVCDHTIDMAHDVAARDYVVLLADMYGVGYGEKEKTNDDLMKSARAARNDLPFLLGCAGAADAGVDGIDAMGNIDTSRGLAAPGAASNRLAVRRQPSRRRR